MKKIDQFRAWLKGRYAPKPREPRMYVVVRGDLSPGLQAAQAVHVAAYLAARDPGACYEHPTVTVLSVENEEELCDLYLAEVYGLQVAFFEPDLNDEMTAFAVYSTGEEFAHLPLALREYGLAK